MPPAAPKPTTQPSKQRATTGSVKASGTVTATTISATTVNSTSINATGTITAATFGDGTGSVNATSISGSSISATNLSLLQALDLSTINDSAFYPPIMTTAERDTYTSAGIVAGAIIYNSSVNKHQGYDGTNWNNFW